MLAPGSRHADHARHRIHCRSSYHVLGLGDMLGRHRHYQYASMLHMLPLDEPGEKVRMAIFVQCYALQSQDCQDRRISLSAQTAYRQTNPYSNFCAPRTA